ncbi:MAG: hypothetical protein ABIQ95_17340 [Bdellovibrionia bacterium]
MIKLIKRTLLGLLLWTSLPLTNSFAVTCSDNVILGDTIYMAASSAERAFLHFDEDQLFQEYIADLIKGRGQKTCALKGCGNLAKNPETSLYLGPELTAISVDHDRADMEYYRNEYPWVFSNMGYQWLGDLIWSCGKTMAAGSLLSGISYNYSIPLVVLGTVTTIVSRPIGRINPAEISAAQGLAKIKDGKPYGKISKTSESRRPHQIFTSVTCLEPGTIKTELEVRVDLNSSCK